MNHKLSIIIPCYNCARTLKEAVSSCYAQELDETEFEIIMVDDGSSDSTRSLMQLIQKEHSNIKLIFHETNRGGGAARNTGISEAQGEIIYCLDSDNFFAENSVRQILDYFAKTNADGVAFYERRFFIDTNTKKYNTHKNNIAARNIQLFDIFNGSGTLLDNFFYTKKSYLRTSGYPEHHGFDTQSFEIRFLSSGNTVQVCPGSTFWHRQAGKEKSYFERVYESGEYSINMYYIMEDIMHLLSSSARDLILNYDSFKESKLGDKNLLGSLIEMCGKEEYSLFNNNYCQYLTSTGFSDYRASEGQNDILITAIWLYRNKQYSEASLKFMDLLSMFNKSNILYYNILRCAVGKSNSIHHERIEKETMSLAKSLTLTKQKIELNPNIFKRFTYKIITMMR